MIITLSPSKSLNQNPHQIHEIPQNPKFLEHTTKLAKVMKNQSSLDLQKLMKISEKLGDLNYTRFQNWTDKFTLKNSFPALWGFSGDVYRGFCLDEYSQTNIDFAQKHVRILSGFYGLISPTDHISPYRLEMGTRINFDIDGKKYKNLYEYWKEDITNEMNELLKEDNVWINLASEEYSKAIDRKKILENNYKIIDIDFKTNKNGVLKTIGIFAKRHRGRMANWIIQEGITNIEDIKKYKNDTFVFREDLSSDERFVFVG